MKRVFAIEHWCVGCGRCEVACKVAHSESGSIVSAYRFETPDPHARVRVEGGRERSVPVNCRHCDDPLCVSACISGAMTKDPETGVVSCDREKCVGCLTCVSFCPYGALSFGPYRNKTVVYKCDICGCGAGETDRIPECVKSCPNRALVYLESEAM